MKEVNRTKENKRIFSNSTTDLAGKKNYCVNKYLQQSTADIETERVFRVIVEDEYSRKKLIKTSCT